MTYLEKKGHQPIKYLTGGKISYVCPLPGHNETKPSFIVWTNAEYENFHCFGCGSGHSIIQLVSLMEGFGFKETVKKLSDGMEISAEEDVKYELKKLGKELYYRHENEFAQAAMSLGNQCRCYLESVNNDSVECELVDKFWKIIDSYISGCEFDKLEESLMYLSVVLEKRRQKVDAMKLEIKRKQYASA